ncbi:MAG TPA: hypothetical protein VIH13_02165 [Candidatus Hydromicrobium sp.]
MHGFFMQQFQQVLRPNGFFIIFRILFYLPYITAGLLAAAVAVWIIFGIKKLRWAKILAIILTVLVVITGVLSLGTLLLGRFRGGFPSDGEQFQRFEEWRDTGIEESAYYNITDNMEVVF